MLFSLSALVGLTLTWLLNEKGSSSSPPELLIQLPKEFLQARIANHAKQQVQGGDPMEKRGEGEEREAMNETVSVVRQPMKHAEGNNSNGQFRLVCYYTFPNKLDSASASSSATDELLPKDIDPHLCTHLNVGFIPIVNNSLELPENHKMYLRTQIRDLRLKNKDLKILFWVGGGAFDYGFTDMVQNHKTRKTFIQSLKYNLETFCVDGVDLDWEFPSPYHKDRQHFSQLLHEIRREYQREHRTYLLTIAMPAPAQYQDALYDIRMINENVDFVNVMAYDYNLYSAATPYTGLNAPLYPSAVDKGLFAYLNINYTAYNLLAHGLDRSKIVIGLPTYGHSYR